MHELYKQRGIVRRSSDLKTVMNPKTYNNRLTPKQIFEKHVLPLYPEVFGEWFSATFPDPARWYAARLAYAHSLAVMSMVGYVDELARGADCMGCTLGGGERRRCSRRDHVEYGTLGE